MYKTRIVILFVFISCCGLHAYGQNFFWSDREFGQGALNEDLSLEANLGESGTVFLYYDHAEFQNISDYISLDFSWQTENVVAFEEAETFDFDITVDGYAFASRWGPFAHGPADLVTDNSVEGFVAFRTATGFGIRSNTLGNPLTDFGYDFSANAFQIGSFDWSALNPGATNLGIDELLVSENGMNLDLPIRELTINVGPTLLGDVNCDGEVNLLDVAPFVELIINGTFSEKADFDGNGSVDLLDVAPFVDAIATG